MKVDLSKYPLEELKPKFEDIERKRATFKKFEKSILEKKARLQGAKKVTLDNLEDALNNNTVASSEEIEILDEQLSQVSKEFHNEVYDLQALVPWYIHFETRRQIRSNGIEKKYRKLIQNIVSNFEELKNIQEQVQETNDKIAKELSQSYDLSGCRTETELYRITPFFRTHHGTINLPMELQEAKDFLKDK
ncbi:hypothetical protein HO757_09920 [Streptococcus suis]|uniref:Uncharacterized protein n=1 Tax=Streptococcus suis TaxID=1307 RepID=A0A123VB79_STRSU|nr:hypothetical protein [Streptococcus suis]NQN59985.1 hypothetical protein [Streptococcus suis]NQP75840.1 hypothetical protein [Streptococcus suis]NQP77868.1 hypothetical protein [Streptococcus suis]NQP92171.1 hypothetical protein [Streptococcus suis]NQP94162.1 hypothetical protein [Streptococcus suis]